MVEKVLGFRKKDAEQNYIFKGEINKEVQIINYTIDEDELVPVVSLEQYETLKKTNKLLLKKEKEIILNSYNRGKKHFLEWLKEACKKELNYTKTCFCMRCMDVKKLLVAAEKVVDKNG